MSKQYHLDIKVSISIQLFKKGTIAANGIYQLTKSESQKEDNCLESTKPQSTLILITLKEDCFL